MERIFVGTAIVIGVAALANGCLMLVSPANWYLSVPGVTSTGPFNQHFVRDIGLIFILIGGAYLIGAIRPANRLALWGAATIWLVGHAFFHFWEVAVGICGPSAIIRDFAAVTLPAILGCCLSLYALMSPRKSGAPTELTSVFDRT